MRLLGIWRSIAIAILIAGPAAAAERAKLAGYEDFAFGISESEIRKLATIAKEYPDPEGNWFTLADHAELDGMNYEIRLRTERRALVEINLVRISAMEMDVCKAIFTQMVTAVRSRYGEPDEPPRTPPLPVSMGYMGFANFTFQDGGRIDVNVITRPGNTGECMQMIAYKPSGRP
jgi:hypothetical protein